MKINNYEFEEELISKGITLIAGCDEVGRGPIAGPVVATAIIMPITNLIEGVTDSKKISDKKRRELLPLIEKNAIAVETIFLDEKVIDEINIYQASKLAMEMAIRKLSTKPQHVLSDAMKLDIDIDTTPIIKGDLKSYTIACASIVAKIKRDDFMIELDKKFPQYALKEHKGYPTKKHVQAVNEYGVQDFHRKTYITIKRILENNKKIS